MATTRDFIRSRPTGYYRIPDPEFEAKRLVITDDPDDPERLRRVEFYKRMFDQTGRIGYLPQEERDLT